MFKTSDRAWQFARRVTGVGYEVEQAEEVKGSKWERIAREIELEEQAQEDPQLRLLKDIQSRDPKDTLDILTGAKTTEDPLDNPRADKEDVSAYFRQNPVAGGCAHDRSKERALWQRPTSEKLELADRFRREGNGFFKDGQFQIASVHYQKALLYYEYTFPDTPEEEEELHKGKLAAHLNLAAAMLNRKEYRECISQCYQATQMDKNCAKAWFRKGQAHLALDELDKAEEYLKRANELASDPAVVKALQQCETRRRRWEQDEPRVYKKMLAEARSAVEESPHEDEASTAPMVEVVDDMSHDELMQVNDSPEVLIPPTPLPYQERTKSPPGTVQVVQLDDSSPTAGINVSSEGVVTSHYSDDDDDDDDEGIVIPPPPIHVNLSPAVDSRAPSESDGAPSPISRAAQRTQAFLLSEPCPPQEARKWSDQSATESWWQNPKPNVETAAQKVAVSGFLLGAILATTILTVVIGVCVQLKADVEGHISADVVLYALAATVPLVGVSAFLTGRGVLSA